MIKSFDTNKIDLYLTIAFSILLVSFLLKSIIPMLGTGALELACVLLLFVLAKRNRTNQHLKIFIIYFIFLLSVFISTIYSDTQWVTINSKFVQLLVYLKVVLFSGCLPLLCNAHPNLEKYFNNIVKTILILNGLLIFIQLTNSELAQTLLPGTILNTYVSGYQFKRLTGIFFHPTPLSFFSVISFVYLLSIESKKGDYKYIFLILSMIGIIASGQRGELGFLMISLALAFFFYKQAITLLVNNTFVMSVAVFILLLVFVRFLYLSYEFDYTTVVRAILYIGAYEIAVDNFPFGSGLASYGSANSNLSSAYYDVGIEGLWWFKNESLFLTDTLWAMIIGESGFIGTFFYILFFLSIIGYALKTNKNKYSLTIALFILLESTTNPITTGSLFLLLFSFLALYYSKGVKNYQT